jgi:hypothetical protein
MKKNPIYLLTLFYLIALDNNALWAQSADSSVNQNNLKISSVIIQDSLTSMGDSLQTTIVDTSKVAMNSVAVIDSLQKPKSKWNFLTGGNDSTYFSFYGEVFKTKDTILEKSMLFHLDLHELAISSYDSTITNFHQFNPTFKISVNNSFLGNIGNATKSVIYFDPNPKTDFIFLQSFTPYIFQSSRMEYYHVAKPFTLFTAHIGPKNEQDIVFFHTQNINPYLNVFLKFKNYTSEGYYLDQETRNNSGSLGGAYNQSRLSIHFNYVFSRINTLENGGVSDTYYITDSTLSTNEIGTRLTGGSNYIKDRALFYNQKIGFLKTNVPDTAKYGGYWFSLQYNFQGQRASKIYTDKTDIYDDINGTSFHLYENTYNGTSTFDSTFFKTRKHLFRLNLEENPNSYPFLGAFASYGIENNEYYFFNKDTLFNYSNTYTKSSHYADGGIYRIKGEKFSFSAKYVLYLSGYKQGDFRLDGFISQKIGSKKSMVELKAEGGQYKETPDYFLQKYYSNHFRWNNDFRPEQRTTIKFSASIPGYKSQIGSRFSLLKDLIYFDETSLPAQYGSTFSVFDVFLNNQANFGKFGTVTRLNYQKTSNERILPLPEFSGYFSLFFAPDIHFNETKGRIRFQLGADVSYFTSYMGQGYIPATALFYNQTKQTIGNYPFIGAFWNFEIKRLRFYLRAEHINYGLMTSNYFFTPSYPTNRLVIRYGITWAFYD